MLSIQKRSSMPSAVATAAPSPLSVTSGAQLPVFKLTNREKQSLEAKKEELLSVSRYIVSNPKFSAAFALDHLLNLKPLRTTSMRVVDTLEEQFNYIIKDPNQSSVFTVTALIMSSVQDVYHYIQNAYHPHTELSAAHLASLSAEELALSFLAAFRCEVINKSLTVLMALDSPERVPNLVAFHFNTSTSIEQKFRRYSRHVDGLL